MFADAALVASQALTRLAGRRDSDKIMGRLDRVLFTPGSKGSVSMGKGVLNIIVNPSQGLAGRPSSARITAVATKGH